VIEPGPGQDPDQSGDVEFALLLAAAGQHVDREIDRFAGRRIARVEKKQRPRETRIDASAGSESVWRAGWAE
jgi:hypothetical protein